MSAVAIGVPLIGAAVSYGLNKALNSGASNQAASSNQAVADSTALSSSIAAEQWNRYKDIYSPLEAKTVSDSANYDTPARYAQAAGDASATVSDSFGKARAQLTRTPGLDPSSPGYQASMAGLDQAQAATDATQQNAARLNVSNTAYGRQQAALALGKGLPLGATTALAQGNYANLGLSSLDNSIASKNAQAIGGITSAIANPTTVKGVTDWLGNSGAAPTYSGGGSNITGTQNSQGSDVVFNGWQ